MKFYTGKFRHIFFNKFRKVFLVMVLVNFALTGSVYSKEESKGLKLAPMVVFGKSESTNSVSMEDLDDRQPGNLDELFSRSPSVNIGGGTVQSQKIYIRNMEDTTMNVTVDGAQQSGNLFHHQGRISIDPELLKSVDVSSGMSGSALNGPGALSGAVRFETKSVFDLLDNGEKFGSLAKVNYYTNADGMRYSASAYGLFNENSGILVSGSYTDRDDYENGDGKVQEHSGYTRKSGLVKLSGQLGENHFIDLGYERVDDETDGYLRLNFGYFGPRTGPLKEYEVGRDTTTLNYKFKPDSKFIDLKTTIYKTTHEVTSENIGSTADSRTGSGVETFGIDIRNRSLFDFGSFTYGLDYRSDEGYIVNRDLGGPGVQDGKDEETSVFGAYIQAEFPLMSDMLKLFAGARFDSYDYEDYLENSFSDTGFSPNAGFSLNPFTGLTISAGYSKAFRGVVMPEIFLLGPARGAGSNPSVLNSPDLKPEEAENFELRIDYQKGFVFTNAAVFKQTIDDYINPTNSPPTYAQRTNVGDFENTGYEILLGARFKGIETAVGVADSNPELNDEAADSVLGLATSTGRRWTAYIDYEKTEYGLKLGWDMQHLEESESLSARGAEYKKESYTLHNAYAKWDVSGFTGFSIALNINNVFDEDYVDQYVNSYNFGYAFSSPGREICLTAKYNF